MLRPWPLTEQKGTFCSKQWSVETTTPSSLGRSAQQKFHNAALSLDGEPNRQVFYPSCGVVYPLIRSFRTGFR